MNKHWIVCLSRMEEAKIHHSANQFKRENEANWGVVVLLALKNAKRLKTAQNQINMCMDAVGLNRAQLFDIEAK